MATDNTARLAKMMKTPEDALRAARLQQDKVNDIYRRARAANAREWVLIVLAVVSYVGWVAFSRHDRILSGSLFFAAISFSAATIFVVSPKKIIAEATAAMQRRLVDFDRHCQN